MAKDLDLFAASMAGVKPLKGARTLRSAVLPAAPVASPPAAEHRPPKASSRPAVAQLQVFDRDVDRALARGRRTPQASLDLHGMTLAIAERAVRSFLAESAALGLRLVLIVTGKGLRREGGRVFGGRLRAELPAWLERPDNRAFVASVKPAHPRHGGSGAFYVLLRRRRPG